MNSEVLSIQTNKKIKDLKNKIKKCGTLEIKDQSKIRLFFGGKQLNDDFEIFQYNIEDESIILLMYSG